MSSVIGNWWLAMSYISGSKRDDFTGHGKRDDFIGGRKRGDSTGGGETD